MNAISFHLPAMASGLSLWLLSPVLLPVLLFALLSVSVAGCGYSQDVPVLPVGARSIAVAPVRNLTDTGEMDIRLLALLRSRFLKIPHVVVYSGTGADLMLEVSLTNFQITRVLDPALTSERSFSFTLSGRMTLTDRRTGRQVQNRPVSAGVTLHHPPGVLETPAIRDEGIHDVLEAFAEKVEREVFLVF